MPLNSLLGSCIVAGCAADLYVAVTAISGWDRQSQYDRSAEEALALAPSLSPRSFSRSRGPSVDISKRIPFVVMGYPRAKRRVASRHLATGRSGRRLLLLLRGFDRQNADHCSMSRRRLSSKSPR